MTFYREIKDCIRDDEFVIIANYDYYGRATAELFRKSEGLQTLNNDLIDYYIVVTHGDLSWCRLVYAGKVISQGKSEFKCYFKGREVTFQEGRNANGDYNGKVIVDGEVVPC